MSRPILSAAILMILFTGATIAAAGAQAANEGDFTYDPTPRPPDRPEEICGKDYVRHVSRGKLAVRLHRAEVDEGLTRVRFQLEKNGPDLEIPIGPNDDETFSTGLDVSNGYIFLVIDSVRRTGGSRLSVEMSLHGILQTGNNHVQEEVMCDRLIGPYEWDDLSPDVFPANVQRFLKR